jgi:hypothetical protein
MMKLSFPTRAPWHNLSWGLFLPLVFAGNVVLATLAWIIVSMGRKVASAHVMTGRRCGCIIVTAALRDRDAGLPKNTPAEIVGKLNNEINAAPH